VSGWGGARLGAGARPKTLLELLRAGSFVRVRHERLLADDRTLADVAAGDPDAARAAAAWRVQMAYLRGHGEADLILRVFGRLLRGRDGWERWAERAEAWFPG
jgi:hypothetical protein